MSMRNRRRNSNQSSIYDNGSKDSISGRKRRGSEVPVK